MSIFLEKARSIRGRGVGHTGRNANAGERARLSARDAGRRGLRGFVAEPAGFSRSGAHVSIADASRGPRGARRIEWARADSNILSRALRDSGRGEAGLRCVLRARIAFSADDGVSAVYFTGERDRARYQLGEGHPLVAA